MLNLQLHSEKIMDQYYQQYKTEDDFFGLEDFVFWTSVGYAACLQEDYELAYKMAQQELGVPSVEINPEWFIQELVPVVLNSKLDRYEAQLKTRIFTFRWDKSFCGLGSLSAPASRCRDFVKTTPSQGWIKTPQTSKVFYYPLADKIIFENTSCGLSEVLVSYVPSISSLDPCLEIPEAMAEPIARRTLGFLLEAKKGTLTVDKVLDGNPNRLPESEINQQYLDKKT